MKKFNKNSLLFAFVIIFVIVGIWGNCFESLKSETAKMMIDLSKGNIHKFVRFKTNVDDVCDKNLSYHELLMDANSFKENVMGTRVIQKDDNIVVKSDSGSLAEPISKMDEKDIEDVASEIQKLKNISEENGAEFLYCAAPSKELYEEIPDNVDNSLDFNFSYFLSELRESDVPVLDLSVSLKNNGIKESDIFYYTDHHWRATSGFFATKDICDELESRYNFQYNKELTEISNYTVTTYKNWFLGSRGKKVGTFFTWHGADDFDIITPNFETKLTEKQPFKNIVRQGDFSQTVLFMDNMQKNHYGINTYATYCGGDFRLQIIKNNMLPDGKKILLIRDSFASVVAPFLSLQTGELHITDVRNFDNFVGDKLNIEKYIKEIKPDYVLVLYNGIWKIKYSQGLYNFF